MTVNRIWILAVCTCWFVSCTFLVHADEPDKSNWELMTEDQAVSAALAITGFSRLTHYSVPSTEAAELVALQDDQTPFLHEQINGREVWQIVVDSVQLRMTSRSQSGPKMGRTDSTFRVFIIDIDAVSGQLIKLYSVPDGDYPHKAPIPPVDVAEKQLQSRGPRSEFYHGFPDTPPVLSFLEALKSLVYDPFSANEIHALYIMHSQGGGTPRPVWIIELRGIDPAPRTMGGPERNASVSIEKRNHRRTCIDAVTGVHIFTSTLPQMRRTNNE